MLCKACVPDSPGRAQFKTRGAFSSESASVYWQSIRLGRGPTHSSTRPISVSCRPGYIHLGSYVWIRTSCWTRSPSKVCKFQIPIPMRPHYLRRFSFQRICDHIPALPPRPEFCHWAAGNLHKVSGEGLILSSPLSSHERLGMSPAGHYVPKPQSSSLRDGHSRACMLQWVCTLRRPSASCSWNSPILLSINWQAQTDGLRDKDTHLDRALTAATPDRFQHIH